MEKIITGYKFIREDMESRNGNCKWTLKKWKKEPASKIVLCERGLHACLTPHQVFQYIYGSKLFIVEAKGKILYSDNDKFVASEMRLIKELPTKEIAIEYAIKCAWKVLKIFENKYPKDKRPRQAIEAAKRYLKNPTGENRDAAYAAANAAADAAYTTYAAAADAAYTTYAANAAAYAAYTTYAAAADAAYTTYAANAAAYAAYTTYAANAANAAAKQDMIKWQQKTLQKIVDKYR